MRDELQYVSGFTTTQNHIAWSGLAAEIGMNALGVWQMVKMHADLSTGVAFPSIKRLAELTGLAPNTVRNALEVLQREHLLRVVEEPGSHRSTRYVTCERIDIRTEPYLDAKGKKTSDVICSVVVDYVPAHIAGRMAEIRDAVKAGKAPMPTAQVRIIPGAGFTYDAASSQFVREMPADKIVGADGKAGERARGEFAKMRAILSGSGEA
ncbi:MAG: hypothetical protein RR101_13230 [Burkholderiaceae bacterium]